MSLDKLIEKLENRSALIGIIGLGYVGLPLMLRFSEVGYRVLGIDTDEDKVNKLNKGESYINYIPGQSIAAALKNGYAATSKFNKSSKTDAVIICVPTQLNPYREPDLSFVFGTWNSLLPFLRVGQVVSLESTTYPGTSDEELKTRIESAEFKVAKNIFRVFSPERVDPGNPDFVIESIPKVCGGPLAMGMTPVPRAPAWSSITCRSTCP